MFLTCYKLGRLGEQPCSDCFVLGLQSFGNCCICWRVYTVFLHKTSWNQRWYLL